MKSHLRQAQPADHKSIEEEIRKLKKKRKTCRQLIVELNFQLGMINEKILFLFFDSSFQRGWW